MNAATRVFAVLSDAALRQRLQAEWGSSGIALCAMHAAGGDSLAAELGTTRPHVLVVDAEIEGARELVQAAARRYRIPALCIVPSQPHGLAALRPLEWGAVDLLAPEDRDPPALVRDLEACVQVLRQAQVVEQLDSVFPLSGAFPDASVFDLRQALRRLDAKHKLVVVGAGPGGPMAMRRILSSLRGEEWSPIVYVQQFPPRLLGTLAPWLETHTGAIVQRAADHQTLEVGHVYVAGPADGVRVVANGVGCMLHFEATHDDPRPLDALLRSVAGVCGARAVGVLLSGRGDDGRDGLLALRQAGGLTITQDRASSLLFDLPGCARDAGGAVECLPIDEIAERLHMLNRPDHVAQW